MLRVNLLVAVFLFALRPAFAEACADHKLTDSDTQELHAEVEKIAEGHAAKWSTAYACDQTSGGTLAWVELKSETQTDGTSVDSTAECVKSAGAWECQLQRVRHATVTVVLAGHEKTFDLDAPLSFDREHMAAVVRSAHEAAPAMTAAQWCGEASKLTSPEKALRVSRKAFSFDHPRIEGVIDEQDGVTLAVDSQIMRFSRDAADTNKLVFRCWREEAASGGGPP